MSGITDVTLICGNREMLSQLAILLLLCQTRHNFIIFLSRYERGVMNRL